MVAILDRVKFISGDDEPELPELPELEGAETLDPDPQPGRKTRRKPKRETSRATAARQPRTGGRFTSSKAQRAQVADEIHVYLKLFAATWSISDEHCGGVLNDQARDIAAQTATLIARSEWLMSRFSTTTLLADCIKLLHAVMPVGRALMHHGHLPFGARPDEGEELSGVPAHAGDWSRYAPFRPGPAAAGAVA